jgi:meso-butanediol dehydrogenase/(S,S)-butanediol dehydrogenase/diacetyl reductase
MARLESKAALITGGGAGIGAACARVFCAEGASVTLVDSSPESLARTAEDLRTRFPRAGVETMVADVADETQALQAVQTALSRHGRLDILVNNAAMRNYASLAEATSADWQSIVGVNLIGTAHYCKVALPALRSSGKGSIVNISSCYAVTGRKGMGIYDATKAGMLALTRTLAFEESPHGVRANAICPGSTLTDFHVNRARTAGKNLETLAIERNDTSLLGRWASPDEIAWPVLWLASDEASFITGTTLMVDGGLHVM